MKTFPDARRIIQKGLHLKNPAIVQEAIHESRSDFTQSTAEFCMDLIRLKTEDGFDTTCADFLS